MLGSSNCRHSFRTCPGPAARGGHEQDGGRALEPKAVARMRSRQAQSSGLTSGPSFGTPGGRRQGSPGTSWQGQVSLLQCLTLQDRGASWGHTALVSAGACQECYRGRNLRNEGRLATVQAQPPPQNLLPLQREPAVTGLTPLHAWRRTQQARAPLPRTAKADRSTGAVRAMQDKPMTAFRGAVFVRFTAHISSHSTWIPYTV